MSLFIKPDLIRNGMILFRESGFDVIMSEYPKNPSCFDYTTIGLQEAI